jgi:SNF2 family DNA or RNA helicase
LISATAAPRAHLVVRGRAHVLDGKLKDYQLEGLQWMVSLHQHGISGFLGKLCY